MEELILELSHMCGDITATTSCAKLMLFIRLVLCGSILYGNSYYIGILVPDTASCRTIHKVKSVGSQNYSQASAILPTVTCPLYAT